ncbi:MAG: hypothetical protein E6G34_00060 [Actinobacteria bacterium]|nr:MAG: hypothetical protein E6G34_00060 [Actinomycetota bacterium]
MPAKPNPVQPRRPTTLDTRARSSAVEDARSPSVWLVLALVIEQPSHGYEICRRYAQHFGSFLPMSVPRLYAALDRLREAGMTEPVQLKPARPEGKQHRMRRSYRATKAGVEAYRRWVAERMRDDPQRLQLLGRITSVGLLGIDAVLDVIERYERECMEELKALPTSNPRIEGGTASLEEITEDLILDQQRRELRARYDWALHARRVLEARQRSAGGDQRTRAGS